MRAEELQWQGMRALGASPLVSFVDRPDLLLLRTPLDQPFLNGVLHADLAAVEEACATMAAHGRPWLFRTGPHADPGLAPELAARGFREVERAPLMARSLDDIPPVPRSAAIAPLADGEWDDWFAVFLAGFEFDGDDPATLSATIRPAEHASVGRSHRALGRVGGAPVVTGTYVLDGDDAVLFDIAVPPDARRAGHGRAMTCWLLAAARAAGARTATLLSSPDGEPLYRELGFETVGELGLHELP